MYDAIKLIPLNSAPGRRYTQTDGRESSTLLPSTGSHSITSRYNCSRRMTKDDSVVWLSCLLLCNECDTVVRKPTSLVITRGIFLNSIPEIITMVYQRLIHASQVGKGSGYQLLCQLSKCLLYGSFEYYCVGIPTYPIKVPV